MLNLHTRPPSLSLLSLLFALLFSNLVSARPQPQGLIPILTNQPLTCSDGTTTYTNGTTVVEQGRVYQVLCNTNILQMNLNMYVLSSLALCLNMCAGTPGCAGATYDKTIRQCTLKGPTDTLGNVVGGIGTGVGGLLGVGNGIVALIPVGVVSTSLPSLGATRGTSAGLPSISPVLSTPSLSMSVRVSSQGGSAVSNADTNLPLIGPTQSITMPSILGSGSSSVTTGLRSGSVPVSGSWTTSVYTAANPLSLASSLNFPSVIDSLLASLTPNVLPPVSIFTPTDSPSTIVPPNNSQNGIRSLASNLQNLQTLLSAPSSPIGLSTNGLQSSLAAPGLPATSIQNSLKPLQAAVSGVLEGFNGILAVPPPSANIPSVSLPAVSSLPAISSVQAPSVNIVSNIIGGLESALLIRTSLGPPISLSIPTPSSVQNSLPGVLNVLGGLNSLLDIPTPPLVIPGIPSSSINGLPMPTPAISNQKNPLGGLVSNVAGSLVSLLAVPPPSLAVPTPSSIPTLDNVIGGVVSNAGGGLGSLLAATSSIPSLGISPIVLSLSVTTPSIRPAGTLSLSTLSIVQTPLEGITPGLMGSLQSILVVPSLPFISGPYIPSIPLATPSPVSITPVESPSIQNPVGCILSGVVGGLGSLPKILSSIPNLGLPGVPSNVLAVSSLSSVVLQTPSSNPIPSPQLPIGDILSALNVGVGNLLLPFIPALGSSTLIPAVLVTLPSPYTNLVPSATGLGSVPPPLLGLASALQDLLAQPSLTLNSPSLPMSSDIRAISLSAITSIQPLFPQLASAIDAIISQQSSLGGLPSVGPVMPSSSLPAISSLASAGNAQGVLPALGNVLGNLLGTPVRPSPSPTPLISQSPSVLSPQENQLEQMLSYLSYDLGIYFPREQMMALLGIPVKPTSKFLSSILPSLATPTSQEFIPAVLNGLGLGQSAAVPSATLAPVLTPQTSLSSGGISLLSSVNVGLLGEVLSALVVALPSTVPSIAVPSLIVPSLSPIVSTGSISSVPLSGMFLVQSSVGGVSLGDLISNLLGVAVPTSPSSLFPQATVSSIQTSSLGLPDLGLLTTPLINAQFPSLQIPSLDLSDLALSTLQLDSVSLLSQVISQLGTQNLPLAPTPLLPLTSIEVASISLPTSPIVDLQLPSSALSDFSLPSLSIQLPSLKPLALSEPSFSTLSLSVATPSTLPYLPPTSSNIAPGIFGGLLEALDLEVTKTDLVSPVPSVFVSSVPDLFGGILSALDIPIEIPIPSTTPSVLSASVPDIVEDVLGDLVSNLASLAVSNPNPISVFPSSLETAVPPTSMENPLGGLFSGLGGPVPSFVEDIAGVVPSVLESASSVVPEVVNVVLAPLTNIPGLLPTLPTPNIEEALIGGLVSDILSLIASLPTNIPSLLPSIALPNNIGFNSDFPSFEITPAPSPTISTSNLLGDLVGGVLSALNTPNSLPLTASGDQSILLPIESVINPIEVLISDSLIGIDNLVLPTLFPTISLSEVAGKLASDVLSDRTELPGLVPSGFPTLLPSVIVDDLLANLANIPSNTPTPIRSPALSTLWAPDLIPNLLSGLLNGISLPTSAPTGLLAPTLSGLENFDSNVALPTSILPAVVENLLSNIGGIITELPSPTITNIVPSATADLSLLVDILGGLSSALNISAVVTSPLPSTAPSNLLNDIINDLASILGPVSSTEAVSISTPAAPTVLNQLENILGGDFSALGLDAASSPTLIPSALSSSSKNPEIIGDLLGNILPSRSSRLVTPSPLLPHLLGEILTNPPSAFPSSLVPQLLRNVTSNIAASGLLPSVTPAFPNPSITSLGAPQDIVDDILSRIAIPESLSLPTDTIILSVPNLGEVLPGVLSNVPNEISTPSPLDQLSSNINQDILGDLVSGISLGLPSSTDTLVPVATTFPEVPSASRPGLNNIIAGVLSGVLENLPTPIIDLRLINSIASGVVSDFQAPSITPPLTAVLQPTLSPIPSLDVDLLPGILSTVLGNVQPVVSQVPELGAIISSIVSGIAVLNLSFLTALPQPSVSNVLPDLSSDLLAGLNTLEHQLPFQTNSLDDVISALISALPAPSVLPSASTIDIISILGSSTIAPAAPDNIVGAILSGTRSDGTTSLPLPFLPSLATVDIVNSIFSKLQSSFTPGLSEISSLPQQQSSKSLDGVIQGLASNLGIGGIPTVSLPAIPAITDVFADNSIEDLLPGLQGAVPSLTVPPVAAPTIVVPDLGHIVDGVLSNLEEISQTNSPLPIALSSVQPPNILGDFAGDMVSVLGDRPESTATRSATVTTPNPVEQFADDVIHGLGFEDDVSTTQSGSVTQSGSTTPKPGIIDGMLQGLELAPEQTILTQFSKTRNNAIAQLVNGLAFEIAVVGAPSSLLGDVISKILTDATILPTPSVLSSPDVDSNVEAALSNLVLNFPTVSIPPVSLLPSLTDLELFSLKSSTIESLPTVSAGANVFGGLLSALGGSEILPSILSLIPALPTPVLSLPVSTVTGSSVSTLSSYLSAPLPTPSEDILNGIFSALSYGGANPSSTYVTSILSSLAVPGSLLSVLLSAINLENLPTVTATLNLPPTTLITSRKSMQPLVDASLDLGILEDICPTCSTKSSLPLINADINLGLLGGLCQGSSCRSLGSMVPSTSLSLVPSSSAPIRLASSLSRGGGLLGALGGLLGAVGLTPSAVPSTTLVASTRPVITSSSPAAGLLGGVLNDLGLVSSVPVTSGIITSPTPVTPQLPNSALGFDNILGQLFSDILGGNTRSVIPITPTPAASPIFTAPIDTVAGNLLGGIFSGLSLSVPLPDTVASLSPNIIGNVLSALDSIPSATTPVVGPIAQLISTLGATPVSSVLQANALDNLVSALGNILLPTEPSLVPLSGLKDVISSLGIGPTPTSLPRSVVDAITSGLGAVLKPSALPSEHLVNLASLLGILPTPSVEFNIQQSVSTVNLLENILSAEGGLFPTGPVLPSRLTSISPNILGGLLSALQDVPTISPAFNLPQVTDAANIINDLLTALATSNENPTVSQTSIPEMTSMASDKNILGGLLGLLGGQSGSATSTDAPDLLGGLASALNLGTILPSNTAISLEMLNSLVPDLNDIGGPASPTGLVEPKSTEVIDTLGNLFPALSFEHSLPTLTISGLNLIVPELVGGLLSNVGNDLPTSSGLLLPEQTGSVNLINDLLSAFGIPSVQSAQATPGSESSSVHTAAYMLGNILSNVGVVFGNTAKPSASQPSNSPELFGDLLSQLGYGLKSTSSLDTPAQSLPIVVAPDLIGPLLSNIGNVMAQSTILPSNVIDDVLSNVQDLLNQPTDVETPGGIDDPDGGGGFHPLDIGVGDLFSQLGLDAPEITDDLQISPLLSFLGGSSFGFGNLPGGAKPTASMSSIQLLTTAQPDLIDDVLSSIGILAPAPKTTSVPTNTMSPTSSSRQASRPLENITSDLFNGPRSSTRTSSLPSTTPAPAALSSSVSIASDAASLGDDDNVAGFDQSYSEAMARSQSEASRRSASRTGGPVVPPQPILPTTSKLLSDPSNVFSIHPISLPQSSPSTLSTLTRSNLPGPPGSMIVSCYPMTQPGPLINVGGILNGLFGGQESVTVATTCFTIIPVSSESSSRSSALVSSTPKPIIDLNPLASLLGLGPILAFMSSMGPTTSTQPFRISKTTPGTTVPAPPLLDLNPILSAFGLSPLPSTLLNTFSSSVDPSRPYSAPLLSSNKPLLGLNPVISALLAGEHMKTSSKTDPQSLAPIITPPPGENLLDINPLLSVIGSNPLISQLGNLNSALSGLRGVSRTASLQPLIDLRPLLSALDMALPSTSQIPLINLEVLQSLLANGNSLDTTLFTSSSSLGGPVVDLNPLLSLLISPPPSLISDSLALPTQPIGSLVNLDPLLPPVVNLPSLASEVLGLPKDSISPLVNLAPITSVLGNDQVASRSLTTSGITATVAPVPPILGMAPLINLDPLLSIIGGGLHISTPPPLSSIELIDLNPLLSNTVQAFPTSLALPPLHSRPLAEIAPLLSIISDIIPKTALLPGLPSPLIDHEPLLSVVTADLPTLLPVNSLQQFTPVPSQHDRTSSSAILTIGKTPTETPRPGLDLKPILSLVTAGLIPTTPLIGASLGLGLLEGLCSGPLCRRSSTPTTTAPTSIITSLNALSLPSNNVVDDILAALGLNSQESTVSSVRPTTVSPGLLDRILSALDSRASSSAISFNRITGPQPTSSQNPTNKQDILQGLLSALGSPQTSQPPLLDINLSIDLLQGLCPGPSCKTSNIGTPTTVDPNTSSLSRSSNPFTSQTRPPLIGIDLSLDLLGDLCPGPSCRTSFLTRTSPLSVPSTVITSLKSSPTPPKPAVDFFPLLSLLGVGGQITQTSTSVSIGSPLSPLVSTTRPISDLSPILNPDISSLRGGKESLTQTKLPLSLSLQPISSAKPLIDFDPLVSLLGLGHILSSTLSSEPSGTKVPPFVNIDLSLGVLEGLCPGPSCRSATSRQGSTATTTSTGPVSVASNAGTLSPLVDIIMSLDAPGGLCNGPNCRTSSPTRPSLTTNRTPIPQVTMSSPSATKLSIGIPSKRPGILDINLSLGILVGSCPGASCRSSAATAIQVKPPPLIDLNLSLDLLGGLCQGPNCRSSGTPSRALATPSSASIPTPGSSSIPTPESTPVFTVSLTSTMTSSTISRALELETSSVASSKLQIDAYSSTRRAVASRPPLIDINISLDILGGLCPTCKPGTSSQRVTSTATISALSNTVRTSGGPSSLPPLIDLDISLDLLGGLCPTCRPKTTSSPVTITRTTPSQIVMTTSRGPVSRPPLIDVNLSLGILEALCPGPNCRTKASISSKPPLKDVNLSLGLPSFGIFNFPAEPSLTATTSVRSASRPVITPGKTSIRSSSTGRSSTAQSIYNSSVTKSSVSGGMASTKQTGGSTSQQSNTRPTGVTKSTAPTSSRTGSATRISLTTPTRKTSIRTQRTTTNTRKSSSGHPTSALTSRYKSIIRSSSTKFSSTSVLTSRSRSNFLSSSTKVTSRTTGRVTSRFKSSALSSSTRITVRTTSGSTSDSKSNTLFSSIRTTFGASSSRSIRSSTSKIYLTSTSSRSGRSSATTGFTRPPQPTGGLTSRTGSGTRPSAASECCIVGDGGILTSLFAQLNIDFQVSCNRMTTGEDLDDNQPMMTSSTFSACVYACARNALCVGVAWNQGTGDCALQRSAGKDVAIINGICVAVRNQTASTSLQATSSAAIQSSVISLSSLQPSSSSSARGSSGSLLPSFASSSTSASRSSLYSVNSGSSNPTNQRTSTSSYTIRLSSTRTSTRSISSSSGSSSRTTTTSSLITIASSTHRSTTSSTRPRTTFYTTPPSASFTSILSSSSLSRSFSTFSSNPANLLSTSVLSQGTSTSQSSSVTPGVSLLATTQPGVQSSSSPSISTVSSSLSTIPNSDSQPPQSTASRPSITISSSGIGEFSTDTVTTISASVVPTPTSRQGSSLSTSPATSSIETLNSGTTATSTPTVVPKTCCGVSAGENYADGSASYRASCDNDFQSGDLRTVILVTFAQCVQRCTTTSLCAAVVYNPFLTACNLKSFIGPSQAAGGLCVMEKRAPASSIPLSTSNAAITTQITSAILAGPSSQSTSPVTSATTETGSGRSFPGPGTASMAQGPGAKGILTTVSLTSSDDSISFSLSTNPPRSTTRRIITNEPMIRSRTTTSESLLPTSSKRISPNGLCGFPFEYACEGSAFGNCCGAGGICGSNEFHCGRECNPRYGTCNSPSAMSIISTSARLQQTQTAGQTTATSDISISLLPSSDSISSNRPTSGMSVNAVSTRTKTVASPNESSQPVQSNTSGQTESSVPSSRTNNVRSTLSIPGPGIYSSNSGLEDAGFGRSITSSDSQVPPLQPQTSSLSQEPSISTRSDNLPITSESMPPGPESTSHSTITSKVIGIPEIPPELITDPISSATDFMNPLTRSLISASASSVTSRSVSRTRTGTRSRTRTMGISTSERRPLPGTSRPIPSTSRPLVTERTLTTSQGSIVNPSGVSGKFTIGGEGLATQTTTEPVSISSSKLFSIPGRITRPISTRSSSTPRSTTRKVIQTTNRSTSRSVGGTSTSSVIRSTSRVSAKSASRSSVPTISRTTSGVKIVNPSGANGIDTLSNAGASTTYTRSDTQSTASRSVTSSTTRGTSQTSTSSATRSLSRSSSRSGPRIITSPRRPSSSGATFVLPSGVSGANTLTGAGINTGSTPSTTRLTTRRPTSTRSRVSTINAPSGISGIDTLTGAGAGSQTPTSTRSRTGISSRTTRSSTLPTSTRQGANTASRSISPSTSRPTSQLSSRRSTISTPSRSPPTSQTSPARTTPAKTTRFPSMSSRVTTSRSIVTPSGRLGGGTLTGAENPGDLSTVIRSRSSTRTRTSSLITGTPRAGGGDLGEPAYTPIASLPWWAWNEPAEGGDGVLNEDDDDGYGSGGDGEDEDDGSDSSPPPSSGCFYDCECDWWWTDEEDSAGEGVSWEWVDGVSMISSCSATPTRSPTTIPTTTDEWEWYWEYIAATPVVTPAWEWRWHWVSYTEVAGSAPTSVAPSLTGDMVWKWHWVYTTLDAAPWVEATPGIEHGGGWEWEDGRLTSSAPIPLRSGTPRQCPTRCLSTTFSSSSTRTSAGSARTEFPSVTQGGPSPGETQGWRDGIVGQESHPDGVDSSAWRDGELFSGRTATG